ncbi:MULTISPECIES: flavodoxin-dependent (E)-4-hydroxy-3-methylbut-2-enyl-diphosphate synthase [Sporomusa]|jgi:(E)-4-hydroxy-3-methylbut-2-enyl-diphosphate synthase|uniref:4-hydroxy-3-methylbut-2-en-1-yl diphosphate synthase (flavodoxin) n=1 Tax=Sporomusa sphaeroides DSM 2875 TaxID=1337886 RepID=A0ABM9W114_9FIRM|nr:flavodoxin-dependent (E)-4-hydroxy-3-methylbut-2-enyl-diphosphate synthase [Sporomusa sphaeroides]MCM0760153.1 flavodoxin-dependent (E)-4-hydroxy-3-methylbut-2-enyl-diphosphate synthase [Sporomusa sphaeroides DSM 2875]OLS58198.1 4-hydroxy-3-methylbut-2-en-1-yl diphosphate synthase [Sporomusa sphaeroides DSM 2875]CVK17615.1 4-hydroxy-3-methylbut-2-en-1-yl diphosphate synthase [Sporomusa sphaeroides DSM 2875]HML31531.1 flavodoxin-dependent (E)-4-hydroxy-3-methylbut-2-enyl-diphosphate synthase 
MQRKQTRPIQIDKITVGGGAPISIQSMTNTRTDNVPETVAQIKRLLDAGCDIVRIAVPDMNAAQAIAAIKAAVEVPLIADIHFDYRLALAAIEHGVNGLRLNPGNIGDADQVAAVVKAAKKRRTPIRIGVNAGSLSKEMLARHGGSPTAEAMVESALKHIRILEKHNFNDIKISLKAHDVPLTIRAYQLMSEAVDYPLHLGITEAGTVRSGVIKSAVGIGALLAQGIGDTLRVSLTGDPVEEIHVANEILKSLGLRQYGPTLVSCPTCGRCQINLVDIAEMVEDKLKLFKKPITVAVMGCVVNGPGEAKEADVGIAGGKGEGLLFSKGKIIRKVPEDELISALFAEIDKLNKEANN